MEAPSSSAIAKLVIRQFPNWASVKVERVAEGGSTRVYRVRTAESVFYLRERPEVGASLVPEALAHHRLRSRGVRVPDVLYVARWDPDLARSIMLTTAIAGRPIGHGVPPANYRSILREAGRDLAELNRLLVAGFGWVVDDLDAEGTLRAENSAYAEWVEREYNDWRQPLTESGVLSDAAGREIEELMRAELSSVASEQAYLAHGDFDVTHIYHDNGRYTGIIDLGEIRGAPALYDLGHFQIENGGLLPYLLEGYDQVTPLPRDRARAIHFQSLLIALRRAVRHLRTGRQILTADLAAIRRGKMLLER